jgi:hypothetical protein
MSVDTPQVQCKIAIWSAIPAVLMAAISYFLGIKLFGYGVLFGGFLSMLNLIIVGKLLDVALRKASPDLARVVSFVGYHVRFWLIVIILYLVIPRAHYLFGVGTFFGILLPKMVMGIFVVLYSDKEEKGI